VPTNQSQPFLTYNSCNDLVVHMIDSFHIGFAHLSNRRHAQYLHPPHAVKVGLSILRVIDVKELRVHTRGRRRSDLEVLTSSDEGKAQ
jgi:hypothetical protein